LRLHSFPTRRSSDLQRSFDRELRISGLLRNEPHDSADDNHTRDEQPELSFAIGAFGALTYRHSGACDWPLVFDVPYDTFEALSPDRKSTRLNSSHEW